MRGIRISVVYALPDHQEIIELECPQGCSIGQAIKSSEICDKYSEIDLETHEVGVFGLKQNLDYVLDENDRVEIYRPLTISPKEARRIRAQRGQKS